MPVSERVDSRRGWLPPVIGASSIAVATLIVVLLRKPGVTVAVPRSAQSSATVARSTVTARSVIPPSAAVLDATSTDSGAAGNAPRGPDSVRAVDDEIEFAAFSSVAEAETKWATQSSDEEWSENVGTFVSALLETVDADLSLLQKVECRSTICRIEFELGDRAGLLRLRDELQRDRYPLIYRQSVESAVDAGAPVLHVYIGREFNSHGGR